MDYPTAQLPLGYSWKKYALLIVQQTKMIKFISQRDDVTMYFDNGILVGPDTTIGDLIKNIQARINELADMPPHIYDFGGIKTCVNVSHQDQGVNVSHQDQGVSSRLNCKDMNKVKIDADHRPLRVLRFTLENGDDIRINARRNGTVVLRYIGTYTDILSDPLPAHFISPDTKLADIFLPNSPKTPVLNMLENYLYKKKVSRTLMNVSDMYSMNSMLKHA